MTANAAKNALLSMQALQERELEKVHQLRVVVCFLSLVHKCMQWAIVAMAFWARLLMGRLQVSEDAEEILMVHQRTRPGAARLGARLRLLVAWTSPPA